MKSKLPALLMATIAATLTGSAWADAQLADKKNCMGCHKIDKKVIGPSFKDVAVKYAGDKDAVNTLTLKIMKGGSRVWSPVPMPANPQVSEAEAKQLAAWVLSLK
jgi:cytochrome c